jgi:hypothetical protein
LAVVMAGVHSIFFDQPQMDARFHLFHDYGGFSIRERGTSSTRPSSYQGGLIPSARMAQPIERSLELFYFLFEDPKESNLHGVGKKRSGVGSKTIRFLVTYHDVEGGE